MKLATKLTALILAAASSTAMASDLPSKKATPTQPVIEQPTWTGFYAGIYGGYDFSQNLTAKTTQTHKFNGADGAIGGIQAGYDQQFNAMVLGVAGDIGLNAVSKSWLNATQDWRTKIEGQYSGALRARAGYLLNRDLMLYATSGWAFMNAKVSGDDVPSVGNKVTQTKTLNGYTVGAGIEYKISKSISMNTEYRYNNYAKTSFNKIEAGTKGSTTAQGIRFGLNYRF